MDIGTHTVELDGLLQRYHVHGSGPVCVALPGGPGVDWAYLRMPALEEHLTMVYVEPIGTGGSGRLASHPHGYTRDRYARALLALLDHLGLATPHLLGHSHGGVVAPYFALHHPRPGAPAGLYGTAPPPPPRPSPGGVRRAVLRAPPPGAGRGGGAVRKRPGPGAGARRRSPAPRREIRPPQRRTARTARGAGRPAGDRVHLGRRRND